MISCLLCPPVYQETETKDAILKTIDNLKLEDDQTVNDKIEEEKTKKEIIGEEKNRIEEEKNRMEKENRIEEEKNRIEKEMNRIEEEKNRMEEENRIEEVKNRIEEEKNRIEEGKRKTDENGVKDKNLYQKKIAVEFAAAKEEIRNLEKKISVLDRRFKLERNKNDEKQKIIDVLNRDNSRLKQEVKNWENKNKELLEDHLDNAIKLHNLRYFTVLYCSFNCTALHCTLLCCSL